MTAAIESDSHKGEVYREQDWMTNVPLYAIATYF